MEPLANNILLIHEDNERLRARIAQLEKQLSDEQQWRVDAQLYADKLQKRVEKLESAIEQEIEVLKVLTEHETHFEGCHMVHRPCAAIRRLAAALKD